VIAGTLAAAALAAVVIGALVACGFALTQRLAKSGAVIALSGGIALVGLAGYGTFLLAWLAPHLVLNSARVGLVAAIASLVLLRAWRMAMRATSLLLVAAGALTATLAFFLLRASPGDPFHEASGRFSAQMLPSDNLIPSLLATYLMEGRDDEYLLGDWLPSDRPPLQAGLILIVRSAAPVLRLLPAADPGVVDFGSSVVVQLLWVPAAAALLAALGFKKHAAIAAIAVASLVPVMFVNTIFTWPKMLAGAFTIAAIAILVNAIRGRELPLLSVIIAATLTALGVLSHGGAAFVLPVIVGLAGVVLSRMRMRSFAVSASVSAAAVAALYLPWLWFQRFVHPPGDRLLKWHLAGVIPIDDRSFVDALVTQYRDLDPIEWLSGRAENFAVAFDFRLLGGLDIWDAGWQGRRIAYDFYSTLPGLGVGTVALAALLVLALYSALRRRPDAETKWAALICAAMLACIAIWATVMFIPGSAVVHQGSQTWMIVLLIVPFAWIAERSIPAIALIAGAQVLLSGFVYADSIVLSGRPVHASMAALTILGISMMASAVLIAARWRGPSGTPRLPQVGRAYDSA